MKSNECRAELRLRELGGLGADDSLRAPLLALGLAGLADLLSGAALDGVAAIELGALVHLLADEAERVAERQSIDEARRMIRRAA